MRFDSSRDDNFFSTTRAVLGVLFYYLVVFVMSFSLAYFLFLSNKKDGFKCAMPDLNDKKISTVEVHEDIVIFETVDGSVILLDDECIYNKKF